MAAIEDMRLLTSQALIAAQEFADLYHETFDKRRQAIGKVYQGEAQLVWNGNAVKGNEGIVNFFDTLPESTHVIEGMDTQPLVPDLVGKEMGSSIMVTFYGKVKFKGSTSKAFNQTFLLSVHDNKWKIVSDTYRFDA